MGFQLAQRDAPCMVCVWSRHLAGIQVSDGGIGRVERIFTTVKNREGEKMKTNIYGFFYYFF